MSHLILSVSDQKLPPDNPVMYGEEQSNCAGALQSILCQAPFLEYIFIYQSHPEAALFQNEATKNCIQLKSWGW